MHRIEIHNELKEISSTLAVIPVSNVFTVPDNYFESLSTEIFHSIKTEYTLKDMAIPQAVMAVPEGYFDNLAHSIMNSIHSASDVSESESTEFLAGVDKQNVFSVPDGYFIGLSAAIIKKLPKEPAKVITMKPRAAVFNYAVAAGITALLGLSLFNVFNSRNADTMLPASQETLAVIEDGKNIIQDNNFETSMQSLGEDEIVGYLKNNGEDVNAALLASLTDEKSLPGEDAYYTDDKALENILNQLDIVSGGNN